MRITTLHGAFRCACGNVTCQVMTTTVKCPACGRRYAFRELLYMLQEATPRMMMEAGKGEHR